MSKYNPGGPDRRLDAESTGPGTASAAAAAATAPSHKLRDSCHACASSKVKCLKEKPVCSRCAKRGTVCEYFPTKRGGRKLSQSVGSASTATAATSGGGQAMDVDAGPGPSSRARAGPSMAAPVDRELDAGSHSNGLNLVAAAQMPLASWFTPPDCSSGGQQPSVVTATPDGLAAAEREPTPFSDASYGGGVASDSFFQLLPPPPPPQRHPSMQHPAQASVLSDMATDSSAYLSMSATGAFPFLDLDLDLDPHESEFLNMAQLDFFPVGAGDANSAGWKLDSAAATPGVAMAGLGGSGLLADEDPVASLASSSFLDTADHFEAQLARACMPAARARNVGSPGPVHAAPHEHGPASCSCMIQALGLIRQLFLPPDSSHQRATAGGQSPARQAGHAHQGSGSDSKAAADGGGGGGGGGGPGLSMEAVITLNDAAMAATASMLQCTCSDDDYQLVILSLIVLKVLAWYAAAARDMLMAAGGVATTAAAAATAAAMAATTPAAAAVSEPPLCRSRSSVHSSSSTSLLSLAAGAAPGPATASAPEPTPAQAMFSSPLQSQTSLSSSLSSLASSSLSPSPAGTRASSLASSRYAERVLRDAGVVVVDNYRLEGEYSGRMAAQLVLSKLHRVQRLVNQLSDKLTSQARKRQQAPSSNSGTTTTTTTTTDSLFGSATRHSEGMATGAALDKDPMMPFPLSCLILEQLATDLKVRLRSVSRKIVDELRRE